MSQENFNKWYQEELESHPELQALEEGGPSKAGSAVPSSAASPPAAASTGPRIKLISSASSAAAAAANGTKEANGTSAGAQSEDD